MELYLGGYFIVRNNCSLNSRMPSNLYTASSCVMDILPDTWAWDQTLSRQEIQLLEADYSLTENVTGIRKYTRQLMKQNEFLFPNIFVSAEVALEFYSRFFSHIKNVKITSISTTKQYSDEFITQEGEDSYGVYNTLCLSKSINPNGKLLGYDLLGYEHAFFHSMYCHDLGDYFSKELNIYFNDYGLIKTLDEAIQAANIVRDDDFGAEPALWQPWAIHEFKAY